MIDGKTILAIIPARGGSKRLPGKNLKDLCGKPMIEWTVDAAMKSRLIDKVVVTTEDQSIVNAVSNKGVEIVDRPADMAGDKSSVYDAIFHALAQYEPHDYIVLLQVTSPLRITEDIDNAITHCIASNAPSCISIEQGKPVANGAVYIAWTSWLREMRNFDGGRTVVYAMPPERSVDVDRLEDFQKAERIMSLRLSKGSSVVPPISTRLSLVSERDDTSASVWNTGS